ncbi:exodeoxyribonuclease VII small subunit [Dysgonomonadaceae bacterium zrk40]|nr:exodeoxyribonuclease VII small subunit [Dysgonomonadaceae bacterium zrk40]
MEHMSYTEAKKELIDIVFAIETGELDVDALTEKVKRASELILFCQAKLTQTDEELQKILDDIT